MQGIARGLVSRCAGMPTSNVAVTPVRLRSSFIYLANAVNDLRGNWSVLAIVLAPLLLAAALCLLPDALNLQYRLATTFEPGIAKLSAMRRWIAPTRRPRPAPLQEPQPFSPWVTTALHLIFGLLALMVMLVALCSLKRIQAGMREPTIIRRSDRNLPALDYDSRRHSCGCRSCNCWCRRLGLFLFQDGVELHAEFDRRIGSYIVLVLMIILGAAGGSSWLYFSQVRADLRRQA